MCPSIGLGQEDPVLFAVLTLCVRLPSHGAWSKMHCTHLSVMLIHTVSVVVQAEYNVGELFWYLLWIYIRMFIIMKWITCIYLSIAFHLSILFSEGNYLCLICKLVEHLWDLYWFWDLTLTDIGMHLLILVCYVPMFVPDLPIAVKRWIKEHDLPMLLMNLDWLRFISLSCKCLITCHFCWSKCSLLYYTCYRLSGSSVN